MKFLQIFLNFCKQGSVTMRLCYLAITLFCVAGIGFALYMQHYEMVDPCPLCIFQRIGFMACAVLSLLAALLPLSRLRWFWPTWIGLAAMVGAGVSIRHIQIQQSLQTSEALTCGAGLDTMMRLHSLPDVIASVLAGHGDCTVIDWQLGFLTMPMVALAGFVAIVAWVAFLASRR